MKHVLLIEPDLRLAGVYADYLRAAGYRVSARTTAQAAIQAADRRSPDVVVLELQLTNHSGVEFLYEFRSYADWRQVPVVVVSNVPERSFAASSGLMRDGLGVVAYHYKPSMSLAGLRSAVQVALEPVPA